MTFLSEIYDANRIKVGCTWVHIFSTLETLRCNRGDQSLDLLSQCMDYHSAINIYVHRI